MQNDLTVSSSFAITPGGFTAVAVGSVFQHNGVSYFDNAVNVSSNFIISTFDDGDQASSYKKVFYLYAGRHRR